MKKLLFILALIPSVVFSQKYDYVWVSGDNNNPNDTTKGGLIIDFNYTPPHKYYNYRELNMFVCNSSICDTAGNLMFYTNGCDIAGADDKILENGETINPGYVHQLKCDQEMDGYTAGYQSTIILPVPDSNKLYYLFHKKIIYTSNPFGVKTDKLYYSIVDMNLNNGQGKVIAKNIELMNDYLAYGEMTAVKHANGKDWWLVTPKDDSNTFYCFLFTKDGIVDTLVQTIGTAPPVNASGGIQMVFSPDGTKMFRTNPQRAVKVYDFDRSNGYFTSYDSIEVDYKNYPDPVTTWCAVSPNGRYLYVTTSLYVFQFDLWSSNISASQQVVAEWDGFKDPVGTTFGACQLGPDCKIYIVTIDSRYYHVINNPDEAGIACNVTQHSFILPTPSGASMPIFPNYRLGPLDNPGVPCTATVSVNPGPETRPGQVRVFPNPADDQVTFSWTEAIPGEKRLCLYNPLGQTVRDTRSSVDGLAYILPLHDLCPGVYFWQIMNADGKRMEAGKMIKR